MREVARHLRSEEGWTLVELLMVVLTSGIIMGAVLFLWADAAKRETGHAARYESLDNASRAMERLTREVREASGVTGITPSAVTLKIVTRDLAGATPSVSRTITYDCAGPGTQVSTYACTRTDATPGTSPTRVLDGLSSSSVFSSTAGEPDLSILFTMSVPKATHPLVIRGGASPRNCTGALSACTG